MRSASVAITVAVSTGAGFNSSSKQRGFVARFNSVFRPHSTVMLYLKCTQEVQKAVGLLAETSSSAIGNAVPAEVEKTLTEAKDRWRKNQYVMPEARDHERLIRLMR